MLYFWKQDWDQSQASDLNIPSDTDQMNNISLWLFFENLMHTFPIKVHYGL